MSNIEIINCEQGTDEWLKARAGVITASQMKDVMAKGRSGGPSLTRKKYMAQMAAEIITEEPADTGWSGNAHTERGHEHEPIARDLYEKRTGNKVDEVGFVKCENLGCSPDGLVGDDGGVEIKSKLPHLLIEILENGEMPKDHVQQVQASLMVTGRAWWDFVAYSPGLPLFVQRILPDPALHREMRVACKQFQLETDMLVKRIKEKF